jgi:hypothetical protein
MSLGRNSLPPQVKGKVLLDSVHSVAKRNGEAKLLQVIEQLDAPSRETFSNRISPAAWYPLTHFTQFLDADVRLTANGNETVLVRRAELVVQEQLRGIYKVFARLGTVEGFVGRLVGVHRTYFLNVAIEPRPVGSHHLSVTYVGFTSEHHLLQFIMIGFFRMALQIHGAKHPNVSVSMPEESRWELDIQWS